MQRSISLRLAAVVASATVIASAALLITQFGRHVYPRIPVPYGGGKAVCGRIILAAGAEEAIGELSHVFRNGPATVPVAYEADEFIVIRLGDDTWLRIRDQLVEAVQIGPDDTGCEQ